MQVPTYERSVGIGTPQVPVVRMPTESLANAWQSKINTMKTEQAAIQAVGNMAIGKFQEQEDAHIAGLDTQFRMGMQSKLLSEEREIIRNPDGTKIERTQGIMNRAGNEARGSTEDLDLWYVQQKKAILSQIARPEAQLKMGQAMDGYHVSARESVIKHESKQGRDVMIGSLAANLGQQIHDSAAIQDPVSLLHAGNLASETARKISGIKGASQEEADLNAKKAFGDVVSNSVTSVLQATGDLSKAQKMLEVAKGDIDPDRYLKISKGLTDGYDALQTRLRTAERVQKINNRFDSLAGVADGRVDWKNIDSFITDTAKKDPDLAEAVQRVVSSGGKFIPESNFMENMAFMDLAKGVFKTNDPEGISEFLVSSLKGSNGGNISRDKLGILISTAKEYSDSRLPTATPEQKKDFSILKASGDFLGKVSTATPVGAMFYMLLKARSEGKLKGMQIKKAAEDIARSAIIEQHPEVGDLEVIPNKIVYGNGSVEDIYNGTTPLVNYGKDEDRDSSREAE
jgi:hypothetical protein